MSPSGIDKLQIAIMHKHITYPLSVDVVLNAYFVYSLPTYNKLNANSKNLLIV